LIAVDALTIVAMLARESDALSPKRQALRFLTKGDFSKTDIESAV
jgi:uncharacterized protein with PIN domain